MLNRKEIGLQGPGHPHEPEIVPGSPNPERPFKDVPEVNPQRTQPEYEPTPQAPEIYPEKSPQINPPDIPSEVPSENK